MIPETLLLVGMAWPFGVALIVLLLGRWPNARDSAMVALALVPMVLVAFLAQAWLGGHAAAVRLGELVPGVGLSFRVEPLGLVYAGVATALWPLTALYAVGYLRVHHEQHQTRFLALFAVAIGAAEAIAFADNLLVLFVAYELLTVSTFPLVTHHQDEAARQAGRTYVGLLMGTSVAFFLPAIVWTWSATGQVNFQAGGFLAGHVSGVAVAVLLGLYAYGAGKAALMPLHGWLPAAMVAPTPVSALLHAVAVVKAGVFVILKVVVYVFGLELLRSTGSSDWLVAVACFTILAASVVALTRTNLKERLAYSTISQLAYIVLGAALATPAGVVGSALHIVMHAAGKITLFFCAGAIIVTAHKTEVPQLDGLGRRMPWTMGAFAVGALAVAGLPPTGGAWSKIALGAGALQAGAPWVVAVLLLSTLLNVVYLGEIVARAFFLPEPVDEHDHGDGHDHHHGHDHGDADWRMRGPLLITAALSIALVAVGLGIGSDTGLEGLLPPALAEVLR